jgi:hypothetical protein
LKLQVQIIFLDGINVQRARVRVGEPDGGVVGLREEDLPLQLPEQQSTLRPVPLEQLQARLPVVHVFVAPEPFVQFAP